MVQPQEAIPSSLQGAGHAVLMLGTPVGIQRGSFSPRGSLQPALVGAQGCSDITCLEGLPQSCKSCIHCRHSLT